MEIIPAILSNDPRQVDEWLRRVRDSKKFEHVQVDFIDGEYANNTTIRPVEVDILPYLPLLFDAHLMVTEGNVMTYTKVAKKVGFDRVIAQVESISNPEECDGLALDIHSPTEAIEVYLPKIEIVVVMAIEPGFGGQEFDPKVIDKIRTLSNIRKTKGLKFEICVDGGVYPEHMEKLTNAGADSAAIGVERALNFG